MGLLRAEIMCTSDSFGFVLGLIRVFMSDGVGKGLGVLRASGMGVFEHLEIGSTLAGFRASAQMGP